MKRVNTILVIILLVVMAGCGGGGNQSEDFITVDVTKSYPKKELILQDIFDVEYVALETNDEFVTRGFVRSIGRDIIVVMNGALTDGDIFIFDRSNGTGLRKINRKGQGPEEYLAISSITLDEDNNELFINCLYRSIIFVYDLFGNFKRCLNNDNREIEYYIYNNFGQDHLIVFDGATEVVNGKITGKINEFFIISK
jgi:hypothetical protein